MVDNNYEIWGKCTLNSWNIAKTLHHFYNNKIRYNESDAKWEYYDVATKEWENDKKKIYLKEYFILDSRINILKYMEKITDTYDRDRLANILKYIPVHINLIIKEAKEIFN